MIKSNSTPSNSGALVLTSYLRAKGPSIPSTAKATTSHKNIKLHFSSTAANMASMAKTAPVAVSKCTNNALNWIDKITYLSETVARPGVGGLVDLQQSGGVHGRIGLRCGQRGMPQQFLNGA